MAKRLAAVKPMRCPVAFFTDGMKAVVTAPAVMMTEARYRADQKLIRAAKKYANGSTDDYEFLNAIAAHDKALGK